MKGWEIILTVVTLGLYRIIYWHNTIQDDARHLARARMSEEWFDRARELKKVESRHDIGCKMPGSRQTPRMRDLSLCTCSPRLTDGIEAQYAYVYAMQLEEVTKDWPPRRMRRFAKAYEKQLQNLILRDRILDGMEQYTKAIEDAEKRRTEALAEIRI